MREYLYILIIAAAVTYLLTPLVRRGAIANRRTSGVRRYVTAAAMIRM